MKKSISHFASRFLVLILMSGAPLSIAQTDKKEAKPSKDPFVKEDAKKAKPEEKEGAEAHRNVGAMVQHIDVPRIAWQSWVTEHGAPLDAGDLRNEVEGWLKAGKAELADTVLVMCQSGQRARVESIREVIYPTEWDQFEDGPWHPDVFETRFVGNILEMDPILSTDGSVDLNYAPERTRYDGEDPPVSDPRAEVEEGDIGWPVFFSQQVTGQSAADPDQWIFVGAETSIERRDTHQTLIFLKPLVHRFDVSKADDGNQGAITFEWIETSHERVNEWLMSGDLSAKIGGGVRDLVEAAMKTGDAETMESRTIRFKSGHRVKNESKSEITYPTLFDYPKSSEFPVPAAMESRNVGVTVEIDAMLAEGAQFAEVNMAPEMVSYHGKSADHRRLIDGESVADVTSPVFFSMKPTCMVKVPMEVPVLVAVMTPPDEKGFADPARKVLLFIKVTR